MGDMGPLIGEGVLELSRREPLDGGLERFDGDHGFLVFFDESGQFASVRDKRFRECLPRFDGAVADQPAQRFYAYTSQGLSRNSI